MPDPKLFASVADVIDGHDDPDALAARLSGRHSPADVYYALRYLAMLGLTSDAPPGRRTVAWMAGADQQTLRRVVGLLDSWIHGPFRMSTPSGCPVRIYVADPPSFPPHAYGACHGAGAAASALPGQAVLRCLLEAVERHCVTGPVPTDALDAPFGQVADVAVHPSTLLQYSRRQYRAGRQPADRGHVPVPFDDQVSTAWLPVRSEFSGRKRLVPAACVLLAPVAPLDPRFPSADTSGCAAGATYEQAVVNGFLELVERDATAIWWYNRVRRPPVLEPAVDAFVRAVQEWLREYERTLDLLDITTDAGIPTVAAVSWTAAGRGFAFGAAARFALTEAVHHAIEEMLAFLLTSERLAGGPRPQLAEWLRTAELDALPHCRADPGAKPPVHLRDRDRPDMDTVFARCHALGTDLLTIELTSPEIGIPVVRVFCPGMLHRGPRFGGNRLYDVPVSLGWQQAPIPEHLLQGRGPFG